MWFNLNAANGDERGAERRDLITKRMTTDQIAKAQDMAT